MIIGITPNKPSKYIFELPVVWLWPPFGDKA
jgi:hypothetical protein